MTVGTRTRFRLRAAVAGPKMRRRRRITGRAVLLAMVVVALFIAGVYPVRALLAQRSQIASLERQTQQLERSNQQMADQIKRLHDPSYLEQVARQCLGMVKPGEIPFVVVPKHGAPKPASC